MIKARATKILLPFFLSFWMLGNSLFAQMEKAEKEMKLEHFADAAQILERMLDKNPSDQLALVNLGICYKEINAYKKSETIFAKAIAFDSVHPSTHLYYGQALKHNHKLAEAREQFKIFDKLEPGNLIGKLLIQSTELVYQWAEEPPGFTIQELQGINTDHSDICPVLFKDGLVITTNREFDHLNENFNNRNQLPYYAVHYVPFDKSDSTGMTFKESKAFSGKLNSDYNDGPVTFTANGNTVYFSRVEKSEKGKEFLNRIKIYAGTLSGERVGVTIPFDLNSDEYSVAHPFLNADGTRIYFASDMPGGFGGYDIYYCSKPPGGSWSEPRNLGKGVNTRKNEVYPSVAPNGDLYFSSSGHSGYGGLDLFIAKASLQFKASENLKAPINSFTDDFGLAFVSENRGYFSSDRAGGLGMDDIYAFVKLPEQKEEQLATFDGVLEVNNEPAPNVLIQLLDESNAIVRTAATDSAGHFSFSYLEPNGKYRIEMIDAEDVAMDSVNVFLLNALGQKVAMASQNSESFFAFEALPEDVVAQLAPDFEEDLGLGRFELFGQIYSKLAGETTEGLEVFAVDDDGVIVARVYTDGEGRFHFKQLSNDQHYIFKIAEDDPNLAIEIQMQESQAAPKFTEVNKENGLFVFRKLSATNQSRVGLVSAGDDSLIIQGIFEFENLPAKNVIIQLVDEDDNVIQTIYTDERGQFAFAKLSGDNAYMIRAVEQDGSIVKNGFLILNDGDQTKVIPSEAANEGVFIYKKLSSADPEALALMKAFEDSVLVSGIFEMDDIPKAFVTLQLVDENNNVMETVVTDANGSFSFKKLAADANYMISVVEKDQMVLQKGEIVLSNMNKELTLMAQKTENGVFVFRTLAADLTGDLSALLEEETAPELKGVFGQIYKKLPGDYMEGMEIYALNEKGEIIEITFTDAQGNFEFEKLEQKDTYFFKLKEDDDDIRLVILESPEDIEATNQRNLDGQFVYESLNTDQNKIAILSENDVSLFGDSHKSEKKEPEVAMVVEPKAAEEKVEPETEDEKKEEIKLPVPEGPVEKDVLVQTLQTEDFEILTIYYSFDSYKIENKSWGELDKLVTYLNDNPEVTLDISSHTDARGSGDYNMLLSKQRSNSTVKYITDKGIAVERVKGFWFGESKLVNECGAKIWCPAEEHAKNRRSEFKLIRNGNPVENLKL